jgi:hypothetical protein
MQLDFGLYAQVSAPVTYRTGIQFDLTILNKQENKQTA